MSDRKTRFIFVTGGVVSSLGKGIAAASIGRLLVSRGLQVGIQKFDPYINVDPGTMSPYQHGEVFVTEDGAETDLDLGHYERYTDSNATRASNVTAGGIYNSVIRRERRGDYLGATVQVVPHITDEIKNRIRLLADSSDVDVVITEIGGTVGDIESLPFLEAIRQFPVDVGRRNCMFIHLTLVPYIGTRGAEDQADPALGQRAAPHRHPAGHAHVPLGVVAGHRHPQEDRAVRVAADRRVVSPTTSTTSTRCRWPTATRASTTSSSTTSGSRRPAAELSSWSDVLDRAESATRPVKIALVGKYVKLEDAYLSVTESLRHAGYQHGADVQVDWIDSEELERGQAADRLRGVDGVLVPGGFGGRGIEGKIAAAQVAREQGIPYLGICLGMQVAVAEFARHVADMDGANSTEFDPETPFPVIDLLPEQKEVADLGGTMRLGADPIKLHADTRARELYGEAVIYERHRHRYEVNNLLRKRLEAAGLVISGTSPDERLVEVVELRDHPFFVASQYHPEFKSRPERPSPLFGEFVRASLSRAVEGHDEGDPTAAGGTISAEREASPEGDLGEAVGPRFGRG
jgi:CTP synthase